MSATTQLKHRRTHNLLLTSKLLSCRENVSPFTLVLDSLEQSARPLVSEMMRRAKNAKARIILVSYETLRSPPLADEFIPALELDQTALQKRIVASLSQTSRNVLIFDSLHHFLTPHLNIPSFLSPFMLPTTSIIALHHTDIPLPPPLPHSPHPLTLLHYLATTILTTSSLSHALAEKSARDRSLASPVFGLAEEVDGILVGRGANDPRGTVLEMEYRRKSGRSVREWFFLPSSSAAAASSARGVGRTVGGPAAGGRESVILLEDHPLFAAPVEEVGVLGEGVDPTSFSLELTEKQRRDREGVVLPYFDAQRDEGPGEGGRILYDMGVEDDFDEEEDEI